MTGSPPGGPPRRALEQAYADAMAAAQKQREADLAEAARASRRRLSPVIVTSLVVLAAALAAVALHPEWFGLRDRVETPVERQANLRLSMYLTAKWLQGERARTGAFPDRLPPSRQAPDGVSLTYRRTPAGFELRGEHAGEQVRLTESDSLNAFLGPAMAELLKRRKP